MEVTNRQKYTLLAFFLTLGAVTVYLKFMVVEPPTNGKKEKTWVDLLLTSLPIAVLVAATIYFLACDSPEGSVVENRPGSGRFVEEAYEPAPVYERPRMMNNGRQRTLNRPYRTV